MRLRRFLPVAVLALLGLARAAHAQVPDTSLWVTDGAIAAAVRLGGTLYLGGSFTRVAPGTGCAVPFDEVTGQPQLPFARVPGQVNAVVSDGAGGWFVGGRFNGVEGTPRRNLVHLLADGSVAPWAPDPDSEVFALALSGGTLYVGGRFEHLGGAARFKIGAVDVTLGLATGFDPHPTVPGPGSWPFIRSLAVAPGVVYAGGYFLTIGGLAHAYIAALDPTTGAATSWNASANGWVLAIAPLGSTLYVGGYFGSIGGKPRAYIAELSAVDGSATAFDPGADGLVDCLTLDGTRLYVGGEFTHLAGQPRGRIGSLDWQLGTLTGFDPSASTSGGYPLASVRSIVVAPAGVYAAGRFDHIGGQTRAGAALLTIADGVALDWAPRLNGDGAALSVGDGTVFVGGSYTSVGGVPRSNLAALDLATGQPTPWAPVANDRVTDMVSDGTSLYVGGYFTTMNGLAHPYLAKLDAASGAVAAWDPGASGVVSCLALAGPRLYVGGYFANVGGGGSPTLAAVDAASGAVESWHPATAGGPVNRIVPDVAAGAVTVASQGGFWRFRASDAAMLWSASMDGAPYTLAQIGSTVYLGGSFLHVNLATRLYAAAFDAATGALLPWDPSANSVVSGLDQDGQHLYAAGWFTNIGGAARRALAVLDPVTGAATSYDARLDNLGYRPMIAGPDLLITGFFTSAFDFAAPSFARLPAAPPLGVGGRGGPASALTLAAAPVPARASTELRWSLPRDARVWLDVLDAQGRRVASPLAGVYRPAGAGAFSLRTQGWAPGVYLIRLNASDGARALRRIVVLE